MVRGRNGVEHPFRGGVYVSARCLRATGYFLSIGWYLPMEDGQEFRIRIANFCHPHAVWVGHVRLDEVEEEMVARLSLDRQSITTGRGPGISARDYISFPRERPGSERIYTFPNSRNRDDGDNIAVDLYRSDVTFGSDADRERTCVGAIRVFLRTRAWMYRHCILNEDGTPWTVPQNHPRRRYFSVHACIRTRDTFESIALDSSIHPSDGGRSDKEEKEDKDGGDGEGGGGYSASQVA